jgi:hypothetical protein
MPRMSKNTMSMVFIELRLILAFFGHEDDGLFYCGNCRFVSVVPVNPRLVTGDDPGREGWIIRVTLTEILAHCDAMFLLLMGQQSGDKLGCEHAACSIPTLGLSALTCTKHQQYQQCC